MNYINQLTKDDIRELFIVMTGVGKTFDITVEDDLLWYTLCGKSHRTNASYLISLDDYYVEDSAKATKKYRKFMLRKFGEKYMEDCFWNDMGDD